MKMLVYSNCLLDPVLGSGKTRLRFSEGLRRRGHEVRVVAPPEFEFCPRLRAGKRFRLAWGAWRHARRTLAQNDYDLVEINGGEFGWLVRLLQKRKVRPLLVHRTDGCELLAWKFAEVPARWSARAHRALDVAAFRSVDACVALCAADVLHLQEAIGLPPGRTRVVPPGLDDEYLANPPPGPRPPRIAFLGSWIARKGVDVLVEAAGRVLSEHTDVELDLLGTGGDPAVIKSLFPSAAAERVHVAGRLTTAKMSARLAQAAIFVLPTRYEGYGMATAEAMACGCAVVTTRTGFGADLHDGRDALLVPFAAAGDLSAALERLVDDAALRLQLATAGWTRVQSHRWDRSVAAVELAYREWLAPWRGNQMPSEAGP